MFGKLFVGEINKQLKPKSFVVLAIFFVLAFLLIAFAYSFLQEGLAILASEGLMTSEDGSDEAIDLGLGSSIKIADRAEGEARLAQLEYTLAAIRGEIEDVDEDGLTLPSFLIGNREYSLTAEITAVKYIMDKELYGKSIPVFSGGVDSMAMGESSAEGFLSLCMSLFSVIVLFYGIAIASGLIAREMKDGTLKLMLMRPISRNSVLTAKITAFISIVLVLFGGASLLSYIYGVIVYGSNGAEQVLFLFNARSASMSNVSTAVLVSFLSSCIQIVSLGLFALAVGTVSKNRTVGLVLGVLLSLGAGSIITSIFSIDAFTFTHSVAFLGYFGLGSGIPVHGNFWIAFPLYVVYMAVFVVGTYWIFNKRDIA